MTYWKKKKKKKKSALEIILMDYGIFRLLHLKKGQFYTWARFFPYLLQMS